MHQGKGQIIPISELY